MANSYDLFRQDPEGSLVFIETVFGLGNVKKRIAELSTLNPGQYVVHNPTVGRFIRPAEIDVDVFDIFRGSPKTGSTWLGSIGGIDRAIDLMNRCASRILGDYFVFNRASCEIVASVHQDTITKTLLLPHDKVRTKVG